MIRRIAGMMLVTLALFAAGACTSDSQPGSADNPVSLPPAQPNDTNAASCPFSGGTDPTNGGGASAPAVVGEITPSKDGCIDNVQLVFTSDTPSWSAAYSTQPITDASGAAVSLPAGSNLVLTMPDTTYGPANPVQLPGTVAPDGLDYVNQITVASAPGGGLQVVFTLDQQLQYLVSSSSVPAYLTVGIG